MGQEWLIGAVLSVSGSVLSNLGVNLQKLNHVNNNKKLDQEVVVLPTTVTSQRDLTDAKTNAADTPAASSPVDSDNDGERTPTQRRADSGFHSYSVSGNMAHFVRRMKREAEQVEEKKKDVQEDTKAGELQPTTVEVEISETIHDRIDPHTRSWKSIEIPDESEEVEEDSSDSDAMPSKLGQHKARAGSAVSIGITHDGELRMRHKHRNGKATKMEPSENSRSASKHYCCQPLWVLGFSLVTLGSVCDLTALGFASQTVIAPLGSTTLVSNLWFAPCFSDEKLTRGDIVATLTIVAGSALSVAFASHDEQEYTFDQVFAFYSSPQFFFYAVVIGTSVFTVWNTIRHMEDSLYEYILALDRGEERTSDDAVEKLDGVLEKLAQYNWGRKILLQFTRFGYAAISGIIGAQSVVFAKGAALTVRSGFPDMFLQWQSYLVLSSMFACVYLQIKWLNMGLEQFDALYVVPVFQAFWISFAVLGGLIVYGEAAAMSLTQMTFFALGVLICLRGVLLLSRRQASSTTEKRITVLHLSAPRGTGAYEAAVAAALAAASAVGDATATVLNATVSGATTAFTATKDLGHAIGGVVSSAGSRLVRRLSTNRLGEDSPAPAQRSLSDPVDAPGEAVVELPTIPEAN